MRDGASVGIESPTTARISFHSPDVDVTRTFNETDNISPGKCWRSHDSARPPMIMKDRNDGQSFEARGAVDPKRPDHVAGQQTRQLGPKSAEKIEWNVTLYDPAKFKK